MYILPDGHVHEYNSVTTYNLYHTHRYNGYTEGPIPTHYGGHIHYYAVTTTYDMEHAHQMYGYTGPEINVKGGHIHYMEGRTTFVMGHDHGYGNDTTIQLYLYHRDH